MRAFVSGASGFLGRHLTARLARDGHEVDVLGGDLLDPGACEPASRADVVFHLAGIAYAPQATMDPEAAVRVNVLGTERMLDATRRGGGRFALASTSHVYGGKTLRPFVESDPYAPLSPYAATKVAAEAITSAFASTFGLAATVFRPFNVYGPGQRDEFLVASVLAQARSGDVVKLGDVEPVRDWIFVEDAVDLMVRAATDPRGAGEAFNVSTGVGTSVREVAEIAMTLVNPNARLEHDVSRTRVGDPGALVGSREKATRLLAWEPRHSLAQGLAKTVAKN